MNDKKKEIRKEYIKLQDELTSFIEYYSTEADGWENGMILDAEDKKEYERDLDIKSISFDSLY